MKLIFFKLLLAHSIMLPYTPDGNIIWDLNFNVQHYFEILVHHFSTTLGIHNFRSNCGWYFNSISLSLKNANSKSRLSPFNHTCHDVESSSYRDLFGSDC